jgi:hypothetical protein
MITSRRRYQLITLRNTSRWYNQDGVTKIVTCSGTPSHDQ